MITNVEVDIIAADDTKIEMGDGFVKVPERHVDDLQCEIGRLRHVLWRTMHEMCKYCRAEAEKNPQLAGKPCLDGCEPMRLARAALA